MPLVAIEEIAKVCATSALILAVQELGALPISSPAATSSGSDSCRRSPPARRRRRSRCEPRRAPTRPAMRTTPVRDGDEYVLDGSKRFITNAGVADLYIFFAKTDRRPGISAFVVESRPARASRSAGSSRRWGSRFDDRRALLRRLRVPAANLLGEEGKGSSRSATLDRSRPGAPPRRSESPRAPPTTPSSTRAARDDGRADRRAPSSSQCSPTWRPSSEAARGLLYRCAQLIDAGATPS